MQAALEVAPDQDRIAGAIDATPKTPAVSEALQGLRNALRAQILDIANGDISSRTMAQLQRFCASAGQALVTLERPDALVRSRFGKNNSMYSINSLPSVDLMYDEDEGALAPAPGIETYGANASRGLIESAAKIGKDIVQAQAQAQAKVREPNLTEMIKALAEARAAKVGAEMIRLMEEQIRSKAEEIANAKRAASGLPALPASTEPTKTKTRRKKR